MSTENAEIIPYDRPEGMPVLSIQQAIQRRAEMIKFTNEMLREGTDFGVIPGTGNGKDAPKKTLLKPGAEKLCSFFGLQVSLSVADKLEDWDRGLFFYRYACTILRDGVPLAIAEGSCNSREKKYRWRKSERKCPRCQSSAIINGRAEYGGGYVCFGKKGGCGAKFKVGDPEIESQSSADVENTEPFDLVNTIQKMAQKRAHVAATLIAVNASEFFTQDMEDHIQAVDHADQTPASETLNGIEIHKPKFSDDLESKLGAEKEVGSEPVSLELAKECHGIATGIWGDGWTPDAEIELIESMTKGAVRQIESLTQAEGEILRAKLTKRLEKMHADRATAEQTA